MSETNPDREAMAREYDAIHNRLFLLQILVLGILLAAYQFSGASAMLARGLTQRFGENLWYVTNAVYAVVSVFGFAAFMTPFSYYSGHVLERHYELSSDSTADWLADFIKSLGIDLVWATVLISVIYALLRWMPNGWWLAAAGFYILFSIVLSVLIPEVIMPRSHPFEPLEEGALTAAILTMLAEADIPVHGVFKWVEEEQDSMAHATLVGVGRTRRLVFSDTLLSGYSQAEILALLAQEIGHYKNRDSLRLMAISSGLALLGFFVANHCLLLLSGLIGISSIYDVGGVPIFVFSLFVFSLISMPFANMYSRKRAFAADAYAVKFLGSADALVSAFEKLAEQNFSDKEPPAWIEFLLHSHPSMARRIKHARQI